MSGRILVINGSLGGAHGSTQLASQRLIDNLKKFASVDVVHLHSEIVTLDRLRVADAFVFMTGTYWDSWGSPLQKFFEDSTEYEASDVWLGKPAACFVTMHSVGGKEVLSRLQGVLVTLGLMIPPMSGMVYSLSNHLALQNTDNADLWRLPDLDILSANLNEALKLTTQKPQWKSWPVDESDAKKVWL